MPLSKGTGKKTVQKNTREMISSGYPPKQAYAAAKRQQRSSAAKKGKK